MGYKFFFVDVVTKFKKQNGRWFFKAATLSVCLRLTGLNGTTAATFSYSPTLMEGNSVLFTVFFSTDPFSGFSPHSAAYSSFIYPELATRGDIGGVDLS